MSDLKYDELLKLVSNGKATASQKMAFAKLLEQATIQELQAQKETSIEKVKALMEELSISSDEMIKALQRPAVKIYEWNGHTRYEGERGKLPSWTLDLKSRLTKDEALKFVIDNNEKGKKFIETLYNPK